MEEYITIKREDFDSLKSKAEKYNIGELSDEMLYFDVIGNIHDLNLQL